MKLDVLAVFKNVITLNVSNDRGKSTRKEKEERKGK